MPQSVGNFFLSFGADTKKYDKEVKGMGARTSKTFKAIGNASKAAGRALTIAGGVITGALGFAVKSAADFGDEIDKMSKRTGFSAEALSELKFAADLSGTSLETVEKGIKRMSSFLEDTRDGLSTAKLALEKFGISVADFQGLSPEETFRLMLDEIAQIEDPIRRAALAQDVFGRAGTELLPILSDGVEGLASMRQEAHDLGFVITEEAAAAAAQFNDDLLRLKTGLKATGLAIGQVLINAIGPWIVQAQEAIKPIRDWTKENPELAKTIVLVVAAMGALLLIIGPILLVLPGIAVAVIAVISPLGVAAAAVAAFGIVWTQNLRDIGKKVKDVFTAVSRRLSGQTTDWSETAEALKVIAGEMWDAIKVTAVDFFDFIKNVALPGVVTFTEDTFVPGMIAAFDSMFESLSKKFSLFVDVNTAKLLKMLDDWSRAVQNFLRKFGGPLGSFFRSVTDVPAPPFLAQGIRNFRGGLAVVGERGPELVNLPRGADVISNGASAAMLGGDTFNITFPNMVVDSGPRIRELTDAMDRKLGEIADRKRRFTSGISKRR